MKKALIIVDPINDFFPGGSLPVPNAHQIIPIINKLMEKPEYTEIILIHEIHPENHISFASRHNAKPFTEITIETPSGQKMQQMLWPDHCVKNTPGAQIHPNLNTKKITKTIIKGTNPEIDSYSGVKDADNNYTPLKNHLIEKNITHTDIVGLATDYCVKATASDLANEGFKTTILLEGCRAIATPSELKKILKYMKNNTKNLQIQNIQTFTYKDNSTEPATTYTGKKGDHVMAFHPQTLGLIKPGQILQVREQTVKIKFEQSIRQKQTFILPFEDIIRPKEQ